MGGPLAPLGYGAAIGQPGEGSGGNSAGRCFRLLPGGRAIALSLEIEVVPPERTMSQQIAVSFCQQAASFSKVELIFKLAVVPPVHGEDDGRIGVRLRRLGFQDGEFVGGTAWPKCVNRAFGAGGGEREQVPRFIEGEVNGIERIIALDREAFFLRPRVDALVVMIDEVEPATREAHERAIERGLLIHLRDLLLELGRGFAFVGSQVPLEVGDETFYIDLLFYHVRLHCYFVIELKTGKLKPEWAGKLNFYLSAVDDLFRTGPDAATIGLLLCESHRTPIVEYTLRSINKPIGVSSYRVTRELPQPIREEVPTVEDLQAVVTKLRDELGSLRQERSGEE